jgi:hypothetical protein
MRMPPFEGEECGLERPFWPEKCAPRPGSRRLRGEREVREEVRRLRSMSFDVLAVFSFLTVLLHKFNRRKR